MKNRGEDPACASVEKQSLDLLVPQVVGELMEMVPTISQERISERVDVLIVDVTVRRF